MPNQLVHIRLPELYIDMIEAIRAQNDFLTVQQAIRHAIRETCLGLPRETLAKRPKNKSKKSANTPLTK